MNTGNSFHIPIIVSKTSGLNFKSSVNYSLGKNEYIPVTNLKDQDRFLEGFIYTISPLFRAIPCDEKKRYITDFKKKLAFEMEEKQYYKKFKYGKLRIKKSDITNSLLNDYIINIPSRKYLIDYFNLNLLVISDKNTYFFYEYFDNKKTIVFHQNKQGVFPIMDKENNIIILENVDIQTMIQDKILSIKLLKDIKYTSLKKISDYKLSELQQICLKLSIPIKKEGKNKQINRKKSELYEDIKRYEL